MTVACAVLLSAALLESCGARTPLSDDEPVDGACSTPRSSGEIAEVATGLAHACARLQTGRVYCWGGEPAADGSPGNRASATAALGLDDAESISLGFKHSCALRSDGSVACWGSSWVGQVGAGELGAPVHYYQPTRVVGEETYVALEVGYNHSCAITVEGRVDCWGGNDRCQLADPSHVDSPVPVRVSGLEDVVELRAGWEHSCAVLEDGSVRCWGANDDGQLGDGTTTERCAPTEVPTVTDAVGLAGDGAGTCALRPVGGPLCWGRNYVGQLTGEPGPNLPSPVARPLLDPLCGLSLGMPSGCAIEGAGRVVCWGDNTEGVLGVDSDLVIVSSPTPVPLLDGVQHVTAGGRLICALDDAGAVWCWGGTGGGLGDGHTTFSSTPVRVVGLP